MKFTVEDHNGDYSFIVHLEDDTYALVDTSNNAVYRDDPDILMSQGFWIEAEREPVSEEDIKKIEKILNS